MSERIPKQPLNDPEYTVPEYSVLLPSEEAKNSTAESNTASNNVAPSSAVDTNTAENNAPGDSTPRARHYRLPGGDRRLRCRLRTCGLGTSEGSAQRQAVHDRHHYSVAFQEYSNVHTP